MMWSQHGPALLTPKYCVSTRAEIAGGGTGRCVRVQPGQRALYQFAHKLRRTHLCQLRRACDHRRFSGLGVQRKHPSRAAQHALVGDIALPEVILGALQRNRDAVGRDDGFQVRADVQIQRFESIRPGAGDRKAAASADANRARRCTAPRPAAPAPRTALPDDRASRNTGGAAEPGSSSPRAAARNWRFRAWKIRPATFPWLLRVPVMEALLSSRISISRRSIVISRSLALIWITGGTKRGSGIKCPLPSRMMRATGMVRNLRRARYRAAA